VRQTHHSGAGGWSVQTPVRGKNLAGFLQLAKQDEDEHQIVAAMNGQRMNVPSSFAGVAAILRSIGSAARRGNACAA